MRRWHGTLEKIDLGPGLWVLRTAAGDRPLDGPVPDALEGHAVVVEGREGSSHGIGMTGGTSIHVERIEPA